MLNYRHPNKCVVYRFDVVICDFLEFPSVKFSKIFTLLGIRWETNFKQKKSRVYTGSFFRCLQIYVFYRCRKTGQIDFVEKRAPTKVNIYYQSGKFNGIFSVGNARKFAVSFAFSAHVDVIRYRKTLTFSFECAQIT